MSIKIEKAVLENACMEMIETILFSLPSAYKGTIYRIGKPPDLIANRVTSGKIDDERKKISWGLPAKSGYNPPGKPWAEYRDELDRPLEAMAWCVERQRSWTAEDPKNDARSVRLQVEGLYEDFHHMEPVLIRKSDLNINMYSPPEYPRNYQGNMIWKDSEYVVVAVIKIHFRPYTIKIGSHQTRVIKKLSRSLGTELLSYQFREDSMRAMQQLASDRLNACNILADSLRNAITKAGLIFSLLKQEIGFLRDQWEQLLLTERKEVNDKLEAVKDLNDILTNMGNGSKGLKEDLRDVQNRFLDLSLPPEKGENWVAMQIEGRWKELLNNFSLDEYETGIIWKNIERLKKSLYFGRDPDIIDGYKKIPDSLKQEWVNILYGHDDSYNAFTIERLIEILSDPSIKIPSREKSRKTLAQLKALADTMNNLERNTNFVLRQVLNGCDDKKVVKILNNISGTP